MFRVSPPSRCPVEDSAEQLERLTEQIEGIARTVEGISRRMDALDRPLPHVLNRKEAARELSISLSRLKAMIRDGEISQTLPLGKVRGIPRSEILRLATPAQPTKRAKGGPRRVKPAGDVRSEAEEFRRSLRNR